MFGVPVVTCVRAFYHSCTQGCGCVSASGIPCALLISRDEDNAKLGRIVPRGCGFTSSTLSCAAKAGHPEFQRRLGQVRASLEYWIARSSRDDSECVPFEN